MMLWSVWDSAARTPLGRRRHGRPGGAPAPLCSGYLTRMILPSQAGKIDSDDFATPVANLPAAARYPGRKLPWSLPVRHNSNGTAPGPQATRPPAA